MDDCKWIVMALCVVLIFIGFVVLQENKKQLALIERGYAPAQWVKN